MFKGTNRLRKAALYFIKNGYYTNALPGTVEYYNYWDQEKKRCLYGFTIEGKDPITITGNHYFYLNYCPIDRTVDEELPDGTIISKRERTFPAFYDGDYKYFQAIDRARKKKKHLK